MWDTHIARLPWTGYGCSQPQSQTQLVNRHGGAWYLRDVIQGALKAAKIDAALSAPQEAKHEEIEGPNCPSGIAKGFSIWKWFEGEHKSGAWRIAEFLGCQAAPWDAERSCPLITNEPKQPDVLVIDDLGLGFASHSECWPKSLQDPAKGCSEDYREGHTLSRFIAMEATVVSGSDLSLHKDLCKFNLLSETEGPAGSRHHRCHF